MKQEYQDNINKATTMELIEELYRTALRGVKPFSEDSEIIHEVKRELEKRTLVNI